MPEFDPDAYLREKTQPAFDPDAYLREKGAPPAESTPPSMLEALARGAGQGATVGLGNKLASGVGALLEKSGALGASNASLSEAYQRMLAKEQAAADAAKQAHPYAYHAANIAGSIPIVAATGARVSPGVNLLDKVALSGGAGAAFGGVSGFGESKAPTLAGQVEDAKNAALMGGGVGAVLPVVGKYLAGPAAALSRKLDELSIAAGSKVLTNVANGLSAKKLISPESVREAQSSGVFQLGGTSGGAADRLELLRRSVGDEYGDIVKGLSAGGVTGPKTGDLAQKYASEYANSSATSMNPTVIGFRKMVERQVANKPPLGGEGRLSLQQAEDLKRSLQGMASSAYKKLEPNELWQSQEAAASTMRQAIEDEIDKQAAGAAPEVQSLASQFVPVKQRLGNLIEASNVAREGMNRAGRRSFLNLQDYAAGAAAAAQRGGLPGIAAALGNKLLRGRGPSTATVLSRWGSDALDYALARAEALRGTPASFLAEQIGENK